MKPDKSQRIEEILGSLDGLKRAPAPDFFFTRLKAKMESRLASPERRPVLLRPVFVVASLLLVLLLNALVVLKSGSAEETVLTELETEQSIAADYSINTNLTYELNQ